MRRLLFFGAVLLAWAGIARQAPAQVTAPGFIPNVTATASSYTTNGDRNPGHTTDNSGISEAFLGSRSATHSNSTSALWLNSGASGSLPSTWIEYDLGAVHNLAEMWVWNHNQSGYASKRELKTVYIKYRANSTDAWVTLGGANNTFTLAPATGNSGMPATNQAGGAGPILFNNAAARYVRFESAGGTGVGNYNTGTDNYAGLSEVRFYDAVNTPEPYISTNSLNFRLVKTGEKGQAKLVIGAGIGPGSLTFNSATFAPGSKVAFAAPAPTFPMTFSAGQQTTLTLEFSPTVVELHQTTLTLNLTAGVPMSAKVALTGSGVEWAPGFIPNVVATASSEYSGRPAMNTVNNTGMLSDTLSMAGLKSVMHDTNVNNMWMSASTTNLPGEWLQFDLGKIYTLDDLWVWNFNQGSNTVRGLKDCKIFYKQNLGDAWTQLGGASQIFTLKQAPSTVANLSATNQDGTGQSISFGGNQARYVRIEVVSNWGDTSYVGLSELRFYSVATQPYVNPPAVNFGQVAVGKSGTAKLALGAVGGSSSVTYTSATFSAGSKVTFNPPLSFPLTFTPGQQTTYTLQFSPTAVGVQSSNLYLGLKVGNTPSSMQVSLTGTGIQYAPGFIPNVTATASSYTTNGDRNAGNTTDNSGISGETTSNLGSKTALHGTDTSTMWLTDASTDITKEWIQWDLGQTCNLSEMWIWNENQGGFGDRCTKDCRILYKVNASDSWTQLGGTGNTFTLAQAPLSTTAATNLAGTQLPIYFGQVPVRYVRLEVISNYGSSSYAGLSEVRFYTYVAPPNPVRHWSLYE